LLQADPALDVSKVVREALKPYLPSPSDVVNRGPAPITVAKEFVGVNQEAAAGTADDNLDGLLGSINE